MNSRALAVAAVFTVISAVAAAQRPDCPYCDSTATAEPKVFLSHKGELEIFAGLDFKYRDISLDHMYDILLSLTPGIKWHITSGTQLNVQGKVALINMYGDYYKVPQLTVFDISHEFKLGNLALKPSAGLFTMERYGLDLKAMLPVNGWLAFEAQAGLTGYLLMYPEWKMSPMNNLLAIGGVDVYLNRWNTQFRLIGGRFLRTDFGVVAEGFRHFRHTSVGAYFQWSNLASMTNGFNGGFKFIISIPPYRRARHAVQFRPADNFRFTYNMNADIQSCKVYDTDPEQNERHGWFSPAVLPWGAAAVYDFSER